MNDLPIVLACHGIDVSLAQKTYVVGVLKLFDAGGITPKLLVVAANCPRILCSAVDQLGFAFALDRDFGRGRQGGHRDVHQR